MNDSTDTGMPPCPGRCNRDRVDGGQVLGAPVWCRGCQQSIHVSLQELVDLYAALWGAGQRPVGAGEKVTTSRGTGTPSVSPGADQADEILRTTCAWEDALRTHLGHQAAAVGTDHAGEGRALTSAVDYLGRWHTAAMSAPFATEYGHEVLALAAGTRRHLRADRGTSRLAAPCPQCDLRALEREGGTDTVRCRVCRWFTTWERYDAWAGTFITSAA
ncbi:hypothetical protein P8605_04100 [Streptomyces sp. T-3]|nr:hypothetical protein [Streptomyces sp. T-3]